MRMGWLLAAFACIACDGLLPKSQEPEVWCDDTAQRLGHRVCVHEITDTETWAQIAFPTAAVDQARTTTYLVPARANARVPTVFVDAAAFEAPEQSLHFKFLTESVVGLELLQYEEYLDLSLDAEQREWFAGSLTEYIIPGGQPLFGLTVWDQGTDPDQTITCQQFQQVYDVIRGRVAIGSVAVVPANDLQRTELESCNVPVHDPATALAYEAYSQAKRCGTLRRYTLAELAAAEAQAGFGWQDILVTDEAPLDIQTIIAGIVTGTRQGELSHLNVRSAQRGTPNCYVKDAYDLLARWQGQLVELKCGPDAATVVPVTPEQAAACNEGLKPEPVAITVADLDWAELIPLLDVPTDSVDERRTGVRRFGSKGANLAVLYQRIDASLRLDGFLIPFRHYDEFLRANSWSVDLGDGPETLTFKETLERYLGDATFRNDGAARRDRLMALQAAMREVPCDPELLTAISTQILATYGTDDVMVRFRSSSNAEDSLGFNGAGLYDSTSVCLADENDADETGPSRCDPDQPKERDVCRGLKKVWASLWNVKAFEERDWYGIDHQQSAMGVLVDTRTKDELANIVAFTGNLLLRGDRRYLVNAQVGELDVVSAVAGVWPERDLLTIQQGLVVNIERPRGSTELPDGQWVLDDDTLKELGKQLAKIAEVYPMDDEVPITARILLDTEWKLRDDGHLVIKQIRPFLE
jgi:hypothetical protein